MGYLPMLRDLTTKHGIIIVIAVDFPSPSGALLVSFVVRAKCCLCEELSEIYCRDEEQDHLVIVTRPQTLDTLVKKISASNHFIIKIVGLLKKKRNETK